MSLNHFQLVAQKTFNLEYKFRNYAVEQGLPSSETYDIEQDNEGNIWIASDRGVVKYNGRKFKTYTKKDGLIDDVVFRIYKDPNGKLWFLTKEIKLCYFENEKILPYKFNNKISKYLYKTTYSDKDIVITKNNTIYYSSRYQGGIKIDNKGQISKFHKNNSNLFIQQINSIPFWSFNNLQIKKNNYPCFYNNILFFNYKLIYIDKLMTSGNNENAFLLFNNQVFDLKTKKYVTKRKESLISISCIKNYLWISTYNGGVELYKIENNKYTKLFKILNSNSITDVFLDKNGGYWFSSLDKGIFYLPYISIKNNSSVLEIEKIYGLNNILYFGNGCNFNKIKGNKIDICINKQKGAINIAKCGNKIFQCSSKNSTLNGKKINTCWARDLYPVKNYCLGIKEGIVKIYENSKIDTLSSMSMTDRIDFQCVMQDEKGIIWAGNQNGLYKLKYFKLNPFKQNEFSHRITDLLYHKNWGKIIGTRDDGVYIHNSKFNKIEGLLSDNIICLYPDKFMRIWVGTPKGINILSKTKNGTIKSECITKIHGLVSNEITSIYIDDSIAWIGSKKGITTVDLNKFQNNTFVSKIYLTSIKLKNNKQINIKSAIIIPHSEDVIKIKFNTINFLTKGAFKYRLNKSSDWSYIKDPEIMLINPEDGLYNLEVAFLNETNRWSPIQKIASFEIDAPYWKKTPFFVVIFLVLAYIIFLYIRFKRKQFETKQKLIMLEQKALFAQMNPHFIFNTLNSIQSFLIYNENDKAEYFLSKFSKLLRETLHISRNTTVPIKKEMDMLEKYLELEQMRFSNKFKWEIKYNYSENSSSIRIPNMLIQPFIENSIKHGFTEKRNDYKLLIELHLLNAKTLLCVVEDNGIGRSISLERKKQNDTSKEHVSYGEKITKERLKSYNKKGEIPFESKVIDLFNEGEAIGTRVEIVIPILSDEKEAKNRFKL